MFSSVTATLQRIAFGLLAPASRQPSQPIGGRVRLRLTSIIGGILMASASVLPSTANAASKPTIVLVHGAFQDGKNTWSRVKPLLEKSGYHVVVVNLPGRDGESSDPSKLSTDIYRDKIRAVVDAQKGPVVLVGHSFGGIQISNVAEAEPKKIAKLVYLSAYLPKDGDSLDSLSKTDGESLLGKPGNFVVAPDYKYASINPDNAADIFGNDASGADRDLIAKGVIAEPLPPLGMPAHLTDANFGSVPKFYIKTSQDHTVGPALQDRMLTGRATLIKTIDAGHASYITQPQAVADGIIAAIQAK